MKGRKGIYGFKKERPNKFRKKLVRTLKKSFGYSLVNNFRTARVAEVLADFQNIQYYIAAAPVDPLNIDDYYTEGWSTLRQCNLDGQRILNCGADTRVPEASGGPDEQAKAELKQYVIFFFFFIYIHLLLVKRQEERERERNDAQRGCCLGMVKRIY